MIKTPLAHLALSANGFLFDTKSGHTYTLNRTATCILKQLISGVPLDIAVEKLVETFEVSLEQARRDAALFVDRLHELGIENENQVEDCWGS